MTPKEKADELIRKMTVDFSIEFEQSKLCALIAVDEILDVDCFDMSEEHFDNHIEYWKEVKQEINKL
jgi:hypothetical protein